MNQLVFQPGYCKTKLSVWTSLPDRTHFNIFSSKILMWKLNT